MDDRFNSNHQISWFDWQPSNRNRDMRRSRTISDLSRSQPAGWMQELSVMMQVLVGREKCTQPCHAGKKIQLAQT